MVKRLLIALIVLVIAGFGGFVYWWLNVRYQPVSDVGGQLNEENASANDPVVLAAGDIASCRNDNDAATAAIVGSFSGTVVVLGDAVYERGTVTEYQKCFQPTWGQYKDRMKPVPGNHDYATSQAAGYFQYFGQTASPPAGYYSYDLGSWHIIALNSNCASIGGCGPGSAELQWLRQDLAAHPAACTLAYMHHPRFSSGRHGSNAFLQTVWQALADGRVDVVLAGHDHLYERFKPMNADGRVDEARGMREFIVGTGGRSHYNFGRTLVASTVGDNTAYGVLRLGLHDGSYDWRFLPAAGSSFTDAGTGTCH